MSRPNKGERGVCTDSGLERLHVQRKAGFCKQDVDLQHCLVAILELRLDGCDLTGECHKDALDLLRFLCAVLQDARIRLHDGLRLNENGRASGRDIVDDAAHFTAILALDGHDITAVPDGDDAFLQILGGVHVADHAFQTVADAVFRCTDLLAQVVQGMRGRICHCIRRKDGARDLLFQAGLGGQRVEQVIGR